jgi:hypothetical protein
MKSYLILLFIMVTGLSSTFGQDKLTTEAARAAYLEVITKRADKIVASMNLADSVKAQKVSAIIRDQYDNLNDIYTKRDAEVKVIKSAHKEDKSALTAALDKKNKAVEDELAKLHKKYIKKLSSKLSATQIDEVKDGMTYGVLPLTYRAYQEEILTLKEEEKKQIYVWLTEARERAMDAESSDKKHAWFGKYKGRINNYLSAAGYDLKKEGQEWEKRRKASAQNK